MYTAKIHDKSLNEGRLWINIEFTDGVTSIVEGLSPQDENALKAWVKEKLNFYNNVKPVVDLLNSGDTIDVSEPVVQPEVIPNDVKLRNEWMQRYNRWVKIKTTLIDTGILTGSETPLVNLKNKVKTDFLPDYINYI